MELFDEVCIFTDYKNHPEYEDIGSEGQYDPQGRSIVEKIVCYGIWVGYIQRKQQIVKQIAADRNNPYQIPDRERDGVIQCGAKCFSEETVYQRKCNNEQDCRNCR